MTPNSARYAWTIFRPNPSALRALPHCAAALTLPSVKTFPLAQAEQAYLHVKQRRPGRAVLLPGQH